MAKFTFNGVHIEELPGGGIKGKSPRREQWESGYFHLEDHELAAVIKYIHHLEDVEEFMEDDWGL